MVSYTGTYKHISWDTMIWQLSMTGMLASYRCVTLTHQVHSIPLLSFYRALQAAGNFSPRQNSFAADGWRPKVSGL